jgi:membrane-associated phospholipid phosphatase
MNNTSSIPDIAKDSTLYKFAKLVSNVLHPMTLSAVGFLSLIATADTSVQQKIILAVIALMFSSILPILFIYSQKEWIDTDERTERFIPLVIGIISYSLGFVALRAVAAPTIVQSLMFCYSTNTLLILLITSMWKVSIHTTGAGGPLVALNYHFGVVIFPCYLAVLLVGISRLMMKKHTLNQVIVGTLIGTVMTTCQIHYIFGLPINSMWR